MRTSKVNLLYMEDIYVIDSPSLRLKLTTRSERRLPSRPQLAAICRLSPALRSSSTSVWSCRCAWGSWSVDGPMTASNIEGGIWKLAGAHYFGTVTPKWNLCSLVEDHSNVRIYAIRSARLLEESLPSNLLVHFCAVVNE